MAGYAATARITRARPRFVGSDVRASSLDRDAHARLRDRQQPIDPRPLDRRLQDTWSELREEWSQATFFLFDPNSWR